MFRQGSLSGSCQRGLDRSAPCLLLLEFGAQFSGRHWPWQAETEYTFRRTSELELRLTLAFGLEEKGLSPIIRPFRIQPSLRIKGYK